MIERGKISSAQMAIMMNPTIIATVLLLVPAITAKNAEQDSWMSPIWAASIGFLTVYLAYKLNQYYPEQTLIEYCELILGKFIGKIVGALFILYYLHVTGIIVLEYGEFVLGTFLTHTPMMVICGVMVLVCTFAVYGGLEVIGRCSEIIVPFICLLYLLIFVLLIKDLNLQNLFPIMEKGPLPSFRGSIVPQSWFSEFILVSFFLPYLSDKEKGLKWGFISVGSVVFLMVLTNFTTILLFGKLTPDLTYPVMVAARYISIADFLEHLESVVMAIWVAGTFVKITVFYYSLTLGTAQLLKLSDYRPIVFPIGFLVLQVGIWSAYNLQDLAHFLGSSAAFYFISFQVVIPTILLTITFIRSKWQQKKGLMSG